MSQQGDRTPADFLTRDYDGLRALLLEQLRRSGSHWTTRSAADGGVMLVELLAYHLDHLAYAGDRVAGEAFLSTARSPESVRLHAALGDYRYDRGQGTSALQHFRLAHGARLTLPEGTQVAGALGEGETYEDRAIFETRATVDLDYRRNVFRLERSAPVGARSLSLMGPEGEAVDLRALGLREGMPLIVVDRDKGEALEVAGLQGGWVELVSPLGQTYLAGTQDLSAAVFSNLVPVSRGERQPFTLIGKGGAQLGQVGAQSFLAGRMEVLWALRVEAEGARALWQPLPHLVARWEEAIRLGNALARRLRQGVPATFTDAETAEIDADIQAAAGLLRQLLLEVGLAVPKELAPSSYAQIPRQRIALPRDLPPLWSDTRATLEVRVGEAGIWRAWTEVEDHLLSRPDDRNFVVELSEEGYATLLFGDGTQGARLPAGAQVHGRWEAGDPWGLDVGEEALTEVVGSPPEALDPDHPTFNPLTSEGARPMERLSRVPGRLARGLEHQVVPVTQGDYVREATAVPGVAEAAFTGVRGPIVEVVVRPRASAVPGSVLRAAQAALGAERLAGTGVRVALARPLYVSATVIVDVHPEMWPAEVLVAVRRGILTLFGRDDEPRLGVGRSRGDLLTLIEGITGVVWSQVPALHRAASGSVGAPQETLTPAPDQLLRCLDLDGRPELGTLSLWVARRFDLGCILTVYDPDGLPTTEALEARLRALISGLEGEPAQRGWGEITAERLQGLIDEDPLLSPPPPPSGVLPFTLRASLVLVEDRRVERLPIGDGEVGVLQGVGIERRWAS